MRCDLDKVEILLTSELEGLIAADDAEHFALSVDDA
jgi:hypothetical protein